MSEVAVDARATTPDHAPLARQRLRQRMLLAGLAALSIGAILIGAGNGAVIIHLADWPGLILGKLGLSEAPASVATKQAVFWNLRLPRVVCAFLVGGGLALSGAAMQGLFRNPLADPGLIGVSAGAALGAATGILFATWLPLPPAIGIAVAAFFGGAIATIIVQRLGQHGGTTAVASMLLAGIAINSVCGAGNGLILFFADDNQLRDITFWMLGSMGASTWPLAGAMAVATIAALLWLGHRAPAFNALLLGEAEAGHLGYEVERFKRHTVLLVAVVVGLAVSFTGIIGFVGLVVPHLIRLSCGADHRFLLPASFFLGGALLVLADTLCRSLGPAELPIGIVTALLGAPFFLILLRQQRGLPA